MGCKVAFCTVPHYGGIYSVYRRLRAAVAEHGWDVCSVEVGDERQRWYGQAPELAGPEHVVINHGGFDLATAARALTAWAERAGIDILMPMSSPIALSALPHLPARLAVVTRCVDITPYAYRLATTCLARTDRIVVTSPRQRSDLVRRYRVPEGNIHHIPNAVEVDKFERVCRRPEGESEALRIVVLDRIEHRQKRVLMLPAILRWLERSGIAFTLTVVGDGPDLAALRDGLAPWAQSGRVRFLGAIPVDAVPQALAEADVLLKTSRNEGFPSSLIEAMAAGVVPVVSHIQGVTDWIVHHEETGLLCPMDDETAFADACARLARRQGERARLAAAARADVAARFGLDDFGRRWADVFAGALAHGLRDRPVRPWTAFREPDVFRGTRGHRLLWRWLPRGMKDDVRAWIERWRTRRPAAG